jgi:tetraacyldisaccharide 4'-kinase
MASRLRRWLEAVWYEGRSGALLLAPLSALFGLVSGLRRSAYRLGLRPRYRASVPVVVVGNLSVGGTGKSPVVAALVDALQRRDLRVGILARGYGVELRESREVVAGVTASEVGDEPLMHALTTGARVVVAPDRAAGARHLERLGVDVIVADDGLQHYGLERDLEIVVIDASRGFGNGRLLPAGPLREPVMRLATVDYVIINGDAAERRDWRGRDGQLVLRLFPAAARRVDDGRQWRALEAFRGQRVHAVAAIGNPQRFFHLLRQSGLSIEEHAFADHHAFTPADFTFGDSDPVLMTSKDAVKCRPFAEGQMWELPVTARLSPDDGRALIDRICALVATQQKSRG